MTESREFVLTFHGLGAPRRRIEPGEEEYWLAPEFFEQALDLAAGRPDARITFDDANASDFDIALPALQKRGLRGTFFLVSSRLGGEGFLQPRDVVALRDAGMKIGSHGVSHRKWGKLPVPELDRELKESREALEDLLGEPIAEAACPFGSYNRRVVRGARVAGYERIFTSDNGPALPGSFLGARNTVMRSHTLADVERKLRETPSGIRAILRAVKLFIKRWR